MASSCAMAGSSWILAKYSSQGSGEGLAQAAQGGGGVTFSEGAQECLDVVPRDMV